MEQVPDAAGGGLLLMALGTLAIILIVGVYTELTAKRIPNPLTFLGMLAGLILAYFPGGLTIQASIGGLVIGFGILFFFYLFGGMGGGDVKLMGAVGALVGYPLILTVLFFTSIIGGFMAIMVLIWRGAGAHRMKRRAAAAAEAGGEVVAGEVTSQLQTIPYGVAIAIGTLLALFTGTR